MLLDDLDFRNKKPSYHKVERLFFNISGLFAVLSLILFLANTKFHLSNTNADFLIWKPALSICVLFIGLGLFYKFIHEFLKIPTRKKLAYFHFIFSLFFTLLIVFLYFDFHFEMKNILLTKGQDAAGEHLDIGNIFPFLILVFLSIQCFFLPLVYISAPSREIK
ncbi:MAG: hypothetical protein AB8F94_13525 [Saprospiraceae bacterium]